MKKLDPTLRSSSWYANYSSISSDCQKTCRIEYFNYDSVHLDDNQIIQGDGHPNASANMEISKLLIEDLKLK